MKKEKKARYEKVTVLVRAQCLSCKFSTTVPNNEDFICVLDDSKIDNDFECSSWELDFNAFAITFADIKPFDKGERGVS